MSDLAKAALDYLTARTATMNLHIKSRQTNTDEDYRAAHMAGEHEENVRRVLGDAIIADSPELAAKVREVVRFSAKPDGDNVVSIVGGLTRR